MNAVHLRATVRLYIQLFGVCTSELIIMTLNTESLVHLPQPSLNPTRRFFSFSLWLSTVFKGQFDNHSSMTVADPWPNSMHITHLSDCILIARHKSSLWLNLKGHSWPGNTSFAPSSQFPLVPLVHTLTSFRFINLFINYTSDREQLKPFKRSISFVGVNVPD